MATAASCYSPEGNREWADRAVYDVLDKASEKVLGAKRDFVVERPVDTLRKRLLTATEPMQLSLSDALDIAAENNREFQRQKENLYLAARNLKDVDVRDVQGVDPVSLLSHDKVLVTVAALKKLEEALA